MVDMTTCHKCDKDMGIGLNWDNCGKVVQCPHCEARFEVMSDESYDEESGEESYWFYLENIP